MAIYFYERRLINEVDILKQMETINWGDTVSLQFSNKDGFFSDLLANGEDFRGKKIKLKRYEPNEISTTDVIKFELSGSIVDYNITTIADFTVSIKDPNPLQTLLPLVVYETTTWTDMPDGNKPSVDLGKPFSLVFGHAEKVPLRYCNSDYDNDKFDYIIGRGVIEGVSNVYRNKVLVPTSEYTVFNGSQSSPYNGYAFIRFNREQRDYTGSLYELSADVKGLKLGADTTATRNFARVIQAILYNNVWGLGLAVNHSSFDLAASYCSDLCCDYVVSEQRAAIDILDQLLYCARARLDTNEAGEIYITVDQYKQKISGTFGYNDGFYNNISEVVQYKKTAVNDCTKNLILKYGFNNWENSYTYQNKRTIFNFGQDKTLELPCVRDHVTADKISCYRQRLAQYGDVKLKIILGMEARNISEGDIINVIIPYLKINGTFQVRSIRRGFYKFEIEAISYSLEIYNYIAGDLPSNYNNDIGTDFSNTPPNIPINLTVNGSGTYQSMDGTTYAFFDVSAINADPTSKNFAKILFGYAPNSGSVYTYIDGSNPSGDNQYWIARINGLVPGLTYSIVAVAENAFGKKSATSPLNGQVAPGDTIAPARVSGVTGTGKYKTWQFSWTKNSESDLRGYNVQIATNINFTSIVFDQIVDANSISYTSESMPYGTLYCRVKAIDYSGNKSAIWSAAASATTSQTGSNDIGYGVVGTAHIADASITDAKIANLSADKITTGYLKVMNGSEVSSTFGGDKYGYRDGMIHIYDKDTGNQFIEIGKSYNALESSYNIARFLGSTEGVSNGIYVDGAVYGIKGRSFYGSSAGVEGISDTGHGGKFTGNYTSSPILLTPSASLPSSRNAGSICFYAGWLCFANGEHWYKSNGELII